MTVQTTLQYIKWDDLFHHEKPFQIYIDIPKDAPDQRRTNFEFEDGDEESINDVRESKETFDIDKTGFTYVKQYSQLSAEQFHDSKLVEEIYLLECVRLLEKHFTEVDRIVIFNWRLRSSDHTSMDGQVIDLNDPTTAIGPASEVHVDQSPRSALHRIKVHLPDEADELLQGRVRIVNIWKPINGLIKESPLAVCDGRTLPEENLIEVERVRKLYVGDTLFAMKTPGIKWYYMSEQRDEEVILFKSLDTDPTVTGYSGHTAFSLPPGKGPVPPRQSIEVRALLFTSPE